MIWTNAPDAQHQLPTWSLTGLMLQWSDGSPAHLQQSPFEPVGSGWEALVRVNRSAREHSRWLTVRLRLEETVRMSWQNEHGDSRERARVQLQAYLILVEWHRDDLGVLYLH